MGKQSKLLGAILFLFLALPPTSVFSQGKGILEILRDKGVITGAEYEQAIEEARGQEKKVVQEVKKEAKVLDWLSRTSLFGDVRYRHEGFYNSTLTNNQPTRNRERFRAVDLAPMIGFALGLDPLANADGRVLCEIFAGHQGRHFGCQ